MNKTKSKRAAGSGGSMKRAHTKAPRQHFRFRIIGDAMAPDYTDGMYVECVTIDGKRLEPGRDYLLFLRDETFIFKRLVRANRKSLTVAFLNQKGPHAGTQRVDRRSVKMIAEVAARLLPPPDHSSPRLFVEKAVDAEGRVTGYVVGELLYSFKGMVIPTGYRGDRSIFVEAGKHRTPAAAKRLAELMLRGFEAGMAKQPTARRRSHRRTASGVTVKGEWL